LRRRRARLHRTRPTGRRGARGHLLRPADSGGAGQDQPWRADRRQDVDRLARVEQEKGLIVGVPREIKTAELRAALTPAGVRALVDRGHTVLVEKEAGVGSSITDAEYEAQGAGIVPTAEDVIAEADLVLKVKEPQMSEVELFRPGQVLFTYLHLAAHPDLAAALRKKDIVAIAYETVQLPDGTLPLLAPMSEIAGRMATQ